MSTYNQGIVNVGDPGSAASGYHTRRLFNFADRVADLAPDESPFFVYLSKVAKVPTDDPIFRFLEDRTKVSMTDRSFQLAADVTIPAQGSNETYTIDDGATVPGSIDWLIRGMVVVIGQEASNAPDPVMVRVESGIRILSKPMTFHASWQCLFFTRWPRHGVRAQQLNCCLLPTKS